MIGWVGQHSFRPRFPYEAISSYTRDYRTGVYLCMSYSFRFPYSIFVYQAPLRSGGQPRWYEVLRADDRNWAEYVAGLLHNAGAPASPETKPVLKVVRYGNTLLALPDEATVERVEKVIAKYQSTEPRPPSWLRRQDPEEG